MSEISWEFDARKIVNWTLFEFRFSSRFGVAKFSVLSRVANAIAVIRSEERFQFWFT